MKNKAISENYVFLRTNELQIVIGRKFKKIEEMSENQNCDGESNVRKIMITSKDCFLTFPCILESRPPKHDVTKLMKGIPRFGKSLNFDVCLVNCQNTTIKSLKTYHFACVGAPGVLKTARACIVHNI